MVVVSGTFGSQVGPKRQMADGKSGWRVMCRWRGEGFEDGSLCISKSSIDANQFTMIVIKFLGIRIGGDSSHLISPFGFGKNFGFKVEMSF